mmetsp:Transcript_20504/g.29267  ORF Transcript_20504/g.29267 Transcript_20504/m.29267 type:complete len:185 (+) Transcript_20504:88-642(+)
MTIQYYNILFCSRTSKDRSAMVRLEPIDSALQKLNKRLEVNTDDDSLDDMLSNFSDQLSVASSRSTASSVTERKLEWKATSFQYSPASVRQKKHFLLRHRNSKSEGIDQLCSNISNRARTVSEQSLPFTPEMDGFDQLLSNSSNRMRTGSEPSLPCTPETDIHRSLRTNNTVSSSARPKQATLA